MEKMINGVNGGAVNSAYANNAAKNDTKDVSRSAGEPKKAQMQTKAEAIKEKIAAGEYRIDLDQVARKMAEELLS